MRPRQVDKWTDGASLQVEEFVSRIGIQVSGSVVYEMALWVEVSPAEPNGWSLTHRVAGEN